MDLSELTKPGEFQRHNRQLFRTYSALRYHLDRRHTNGLIEAEAVIESPLGLLINPTKFHGWLLGRKSSRDAA